MAEIHKALLAFQMEAPTLSKNAENDHFHNRYITLDELVEKVRPVLNKHGIIFTQAPSYASNTETVVPVLVTTLTHAESGSELTVKTLLLIDRENPQGQGSAITYARRYALMGILGLVADADDDGNAASGPPPRSTSARRTPVTPRGSSAGF